MTIYEIDTAIAALVDPESGELLDYEAFSELSMERSKKIENMALWAKELSATAKIIKAEEDVLKARRQSMENKAVRLKEYLALILDGEKFETAKCSISYRKSSALEITDNFALSEWLEAAGFGDLVAYSAPTVDKREVTKLIRAGSVVPGAEIVERQSLTLK